MPSHGIGSSTSDLLVSTSRTIWLTLTSSPGLTFHETISASVRPSPGSGSRKVLTSPPEDEPCGAGAEAPLARCGAVASGAAAPPQPSAASVGGAASPAEGTGSPAPTTSMAMIGEPTSTSVPSCARSSVTVPSHGIGSSTSDLLVSISTTIWLTLTSSPGLTFH